MAALSNQLPFAAVLVIDQGEELFTLAKTPEQLARGRSALDMLRGTLEAQGNFKVILALRTEYYGRFVDRLRRGLRDTERFCDYLLTDFDEPALIEAILRPTTRLKIPYASEVPFEKYAFRFADGVAEEIARGVIRHSNQRRDSALPLAQVICFELYELAHRRDNGTITSGDLQTLGGIEGGMRKHVEALLDDLLRGNARDKKPLEQLFTKLYLRQPDGSLTTALLAENEVRRLWTGSMEFGQLLNAARRMRLLKVNSLVIGAGQEQRYVSLGHDALAKIAADWDEELGRFKVLRRWAIAIGSVSVVAVAMAVLAVFALYSRQEAVEAQRKAVIAQGEAVIAKREAVDTFHSLAIALRKMMDSGPEDATDAEFDSQFEGLITRAIDSATRAVERNQELIRSPSPNIEDLFELARSYTILGEFSYLNGDPAWRNSYLLAIELLEELVQQNPEVPKFKHQLDITRSDLADADAPSLRE